MEEIYENQNQVSWWFNQPSWKDRNFIGVELDENYYNIAKKRIEESNTNLFDL